MEHKTGLDEQKMYKTKGYFKYRFLGGSSNEGTELKEGIGITAINSRSMKAIFDMDSKEDKLIMVEAGIEGIGPIRAVCRLAAEVESEKILDMIIIKEHDLAIIDGYIAGRLNSSL